MTPPTTASREPRGRILVETLAAFAVATLAAGLLYHAQGIVLVRRNLHTLVALVFLALPQLLLRKRGGIERYGFTLHPLAIGLTIAALAIVVVLPLFGAAFLSFFRYLCLEAPRFVPGSCSQVQHPHWRLPPDFALMAAGQLIVVALPEELFFRGYLQGRLEEALPPTRTILGARLGWAWILVAALFALGHYLVSFEPQMLTRFFPGLAFGWMYARTRSILAGTLFHAACNLIMAVLGASLFAP
jgi:membrane protease YdiL (CAAX protease family)